MASHVLKGRLVARDLDELNRTQHRDPNQLKDDPDIKDQSEIVSGDIVTQGVIDDVALGISRGWQSIDI